jgi:hypothetical protein
VAPRATIQLTVDQQVMVDVARVLKAQPGSKALLKDFRRELKATGDRLVPEFRSAVMAIPSQGLTQGQSLRAGIAKKITTNVRLSGQLAGVSITAKRTKNVRNFTMAARRLNREVGFNHPVYGRGAVKQVGDPGWFDRVPDRHKAEFKRDVTAVVEKWTEGMAFELRIRAQASAIRAARAAR